MGWREDPKEHAELWNSGIFKAVSALEQNDLLMAQAIFDHDMRDILDRFGDDEETEGKIAQMFVAWMVSEFLKNGKPVAQWYCDKQGNALTPAEKEVLLAGKESHAGIFLIKNHEGNLARIEDAHGAAFQVETVLLPQMKADTAFMSRINSKGDEKYFFSGPLLIWSDTGIYHSIKRHYEFRKSWNRLLEGFVDYQMKEMNLSRKTAEKHMEDVNLLMFLLEGKSDADSFGKVTKGMLNSEFKKFVKHHILNRVDMDKVYYSLWLFFDFLKKKKENYSEEALEWLRGRAT